MMEGMEALVVKVVMVKVVAEAEMVTMEVAVTGLHAGSGSKIGDGGVDQVTEGN